MAVLGGQIKWGRSLGKYLIIVKRAGFAKEKEQQGYVTLLLDIRAQPLICPLTYRMNMKRVIFHYVRTVHTTLMGMTFAHTTQDF